MSQENIDALRAVYEEWGNGNFRAGVDLYDPDVLVVGPADDPDAGRYLGRDSVREYTGGWLSAWIDLAIAAEDFIEAGASGIRIEAFPDRAEALGAVGLPE